MVLPKFEFHEPTSVAEACDLMARHRGKARPLAVGTDLLVNMKKKVLRPEHLVSLGRIPELSRLERSNGPFGAKDVGEGAIMPTIPAILNAVYDATGLRIHELPLTSERVHAALKARGLQK
jgi:CO/xanthine dehydrogenase FAD-binding subunit